ncbi:hypothetical protein [Pseudomonas sp. NGC7]|uniref:hypothetical protein n=1 Tax=Pseudomonas sp. NGC7 TaxID=3341775 RepID=UPI0037DAECED
MSSNYLSVILAWMKQHPSHMNWDLTFAMRPEQANDFVELAHYSRESSALGDLEGEIAVPGSSVTHVLTGYRIGPPLLRDIEAAYSSPNVRQTIALEGGVHFIMDKADGLLGVAMHDLLDPLQVKQELALTANSQGVRADLKEAVETELDLGGGLPQRLAAGRFFKDFVSGLDIARRVYPLVDFQALAGNPYLQVRGSAVRTHVSKVDGKAAMVVFAGLENGPLGNFPTEQNNYPFLLPDDLSQPVTSTLLLSSRLLHRAAYATGLEEMLEGGEFESHLDADKTLARMDAKAGQLRVHPSTYESDDYDFECDEFVIPVGGAAPSDVAGGNRSLSQHGQACCCCRCTPATESTRGQAPQGAFQSPLSIEFDHDEIRQHWQSFCTLTLRYRRKRDNVWQTHTATFKFDLRTLFHLDKPATPEEDAGCMLLGHVLWPWEQAAEVTPVSGLPSGLSAQTKLEINAFVAFAIKQAVLEGLAKKLTAMVPEQVSNGVTLAPDHRFVPFHFEFPAGMALFANQNSAAFFRVVDPPVVLAPGKRHTFTVEPAREGLVWSLEALPGAQGDIGRIDAQGEYRAPPAHAMGGQQVRARVIATDPFTGQRSMSRVTVLLAALTVNPLIHVCYIDDQLTLTAGTLGGDLKWSVLDPEAEGRGSVQPSEDGKRCSYSAGGLVSANQTYVLDKIRVEDTQTGESRSVHVLVRQRRPELIIEIERQLPNGALQLQGRVNGQVMQSVEWTLPINGTGEIDAIGVFTSPDPNTGAPFTLILAKWVIPGFDFVFEGHLILTLPVSLYFDATRRAAIPAGLRVRSQHAFGG